MGRVYPVRKAAARGDERNSFLLSANSSYAEPMLRFMAFKFLWISAVGILVAVLIFLHYTGAHLPIHPTLMGIDVSAHQGEVNWDRVRQSDVTFVFIKASEADDFKDQKFYGNWTSARKAGIPAGAYHFYSLAYDGEIQAKNFISSVPSKDLQLPPVVDLEYVGNSVQRPSKKEFENQLRIYINAIKEEYGTEPIIYTTASFYSDYLYPEFSSSHIWIRNLLWVPSEKNWLFWQYSQWGRVDGIQGNTDLNFFRGDENDLRALLIKKD